MSEPALAVGGSIEARCTKCRKNAVHTIVSLAEGSAEKVQCPLCSREHKYRPPTGKQLGLKRAMNIRNAECQEWDRLRPEMDSSKATDYSMTAAYKVNTLINHQAFGLGVVLQVVGAQKIEVLFEGGKKTMRCK